MAQAKQLFLNGEFEQAKPAFQKLVKQAPSNANYNYWYGACCYETGEKKEAQPYLEKSAARKVIDAYRYLGKLYYDIYRFDDAVDNYEQHIEWLEKKKRPTEMAEAELEQIKQAARMIKGVENITVIDSFVVDKNDFLKAYKSVENREHSITILPYPGLSIKPKWAIKYFTGTKAQTAKCNSTPVSVCWTAGASPNPSCPLMNREM